MTGEARRAFAGALANDATLAGMLGRLAADGSPAVILFNQQPPPVYPCIVYQFAESLPDPTFRPTNAEGGGQGKIAEGRVEVRIYGKDGVATRDAIAKRVRQLLEGQVLTYPGWTGRLFRVEIILETPDQYTDDLNTYFHLIRFRLREQT